MILLDKINSPQLEIIHSGKVRDSFKIDEQTRMIVISDRISSFDNVLNNYIPYKGAVLNGITNWWFEQTRDIIENHHIKMIDPCISLVKEAVPIRVEMIVRGYLTGSMWRGYKKGKRTFSGVNVNDGLKQNQRFEIPLITPTTKEESDREITPEDIVSEGWTTEIIYNKMADIARRLFEFGSQKLAEKEIILVDTKYEFGLLDGEIILIDEIHTPDSSRFWSLSDYKKDPMSVDSIDKEYVRQWLLHNKENGELKKQLPVEVIAETSKRYCDIFEKITGEKLEISNYPIEKRVYKNLVDNDIIKEGYVVIIMGSPSDLDHCKKIKKIIEKYDIDVQMRVVSAHKNGERIPCIVECLNNSIEPGAVIAVAGRSNGLGGALAANLAIPLINCPPFKDKVDMMVNINSSLVMPSNTPAATVIDVKSAALMALRCLNLKRLKSIFNNEIQEMKNKLIIEDDNIRKI